MNKNVVLPELLLLGRGQQRDLRRVLGDKVSLASVRSRPPQARPKLWTSGWNNVPPVLPGRPRGPSPSAPLSLLCNYSDTQLREASPFSATSKPCHIPLSRVCGSNALRNRGLIPHGVNGDTEISNHLFRGTR